MIDRGTGVPIVLVPGIQGRWEWLSPTVDALASQARVITFSLCDEPSSGFRCDVARGIDNYLLQIEEALDRARISRAVLVGVSYSGLIVSEFAARRPERVFGIVLASALPPAWQPNRRQRFYLRAPRLLAPMFLASTPLRLRAEIKSAIPRLADRLRFKAASCARLLRIFVSPSRMARRICWLQQYRFADPSLIRTPALVITGEDDLDRVVPPPMTRQYLAALRDARHDVLQRTGHIGLVTKPAAFAHLVVRFAREVSSDAKRIPA